MFLPNMFFIPCDIAFAYIVSDVFSSVLLSSSVGSLACRVSFPGPILCLKVKIESGLHFVVFIF